MQWIELTIKTAPAAIDLVCDRLTVLGFLTASSSTIRSSFMNFWSRTVSTGTM